MIGYFQSNVNNLIERQTSSSNISFPLINPELQSKSKSYKNSGVLINEVFRLEERFSMMDYIKGGMELSLSVAINFTGSNGNPSLPSSLHNRNPLYLNQYQNAIIKVGEILQDYDSDKKVIVLK